MKLFKTSMRKVCLKNSSNATFIALIPKEKQGCRPVNVKDFSPISLVDSVCINPF
jgi:hypothetical protein